MYDQHIHTDETISANRPGIVIKEVDFYYLIDVSIPSNKNIKTNEAVNLK